MTKREQAIAIIKGLDAIGKRESSYEYGLPFGFDDAMDAELINFVLDIINPRPDHPQERSEG